MNIVTLSCRVTDCIQPRWSFLHTEFGLLHRVSILCSCKLNFLFLSISSMVSHISFTHILPFCIPPPLLVILCILLDTHTFILLIQYALSKKKRKIFHFIILCIVSFYHSYFSFVVLISNNMLILLATSKKLAYLGEYNWVFIRDI